MTDMTRNEVGPVNTSFLRYIYLVLAIIIIAAFFLFFGQTSVWFDEANYLVIAGAIRETGYPIWFGDPDKPSIFIDSPPGLLYLISIFSTYVTNDLFVVRLSNGLVSLVIAFLALFIYIRRKGLDVILLSVTALFCAVTYFFIVELVQVRMDLPLAALTFLVLILAALAEEEFKEHSEHNLKALANRRLFLTLVLLICASALLFLMKFQAVCVTACLFLNVLLCQDFRRLASWLPLIAHIMGGVIGILVLVVLMISNPFVPGAEVFDRVAYDFDRVTPLLSSFSASRILAVGKEIMPKVIVPAILCGLVKDKINIYGRDPLVRLSVLMIVIVVAFNIAVYRMLTAGHYYMIQAALPLGYITAQSFNSLLQAHRWWHVLILTCVLTFHALLNVQFGGGGPERSTNWLKDLMGPAGRLDASKVVAANVAPSLGSEELLLLGWNQSRVVPYWLNRPVLYGYLFDMDPIRAESLLNQKGPRRVGALVFFGEEKLRSREWSRVEALLARDFVRARVENAPGWTVYRRND
jgi:hypothetical protein